ncbi:MAG: hemerythrin domain-containing protein [Erythrobacter sp.]
MSFLDTIASSLAPAASAEDRAEARRKIKGLAANETWLRMIVEQHERIEALLEKARTGPDAQVRRDALKDLMTELTGHSNAEEVIVYPIVSEDAGKTEAAIAYQQHAMTKVNLSKLERMDPATEDWMEKLEHVQSAVQQHIYQEEGSWLPDVVEKASPAEREMMSRRYAEEYERYASPAAA